MASKHYLLFVSQAWGPSLGRTFRRLSSGGSVRVVALSTSARDELNRLGIESVQVESYAERSDEFDLTRSAITELNDFPSRKVADRSFGEWLSYQNLPLWPFISPNLFADVNTQAKTLTILDKIVCSEEPDCIVALDTQKLPFLWSFLRGLAKEPVLIDRLAWAVAKRHGIEWQSVRPSFKVRVRHRLTNLCGQAFIALRGGVWMVFIAALIRSLLAGVAGIVRRKKRAVQGGVMLFSHRKYWRREYNPLQAKMAMTDTAIYPVAKALMDIGEQVRCLDGNYGFVGGLRELRQKLFNENSLPWSTFDTWYPLRRIWGLRTAAQNAAGVLDHKRDLEDLFSYGGFATGALFLPRLRFLLTDYLWKSVLWIEAGRHMIDSEKPDVVALTYETGTLSRAIINACHERDIPCIGMQHGAFSDATDDYMRTASTHIQNYVPGKTAIWGERFRRVLVEQSAYAEDEVEVTGNPRMDFIVGARSLLDPSQVYEKYGLDRQRRIVLAAPTETIGRTQHMAKDRFFDGIVDAARTRPDIQWIVKLKPGAESERYYRQRIRELGAATLILTEDDLYSLLVAADIVVTPPSSIAIEALLMRKPVVYTAFADAEDYFPHLIESGAVFTQRTMDGLAEKIESICKEYPRGLLSDEKLEELVSEENYKPDGKATARVVNLIQKAKLRPPTPAAIREKRGDWN